MQHKPQPAERFKRWSLLSFKPELGTERILPRRSDSGLSAVDGLGHSGVYSIAMTASSGWHMVTVELGSKSETPTPPGIRTLRCSARARSCTPRAVSCNSFLATGGVFKQGIPSRTAPPQGGAVQLSDFSPLAPPFAA